MKSPFPGMDPFIEACGLWADFHHDLLSAIKHELARTAPDHYLIRTEERSYLVLVGEEGKSAYPFLPDVSVIEPERRKKPSKAKESVAVLEPDIESESMAIRAFIEEEHREAFIEIYEAEPEQRLVTCIEVLSPSNKRPRTEGWNLYLRKRQSLMLGNVNLVEIDLLRGGQRMPMLDPWPKSPYTILVARAGKSGLCRTWPVHFQKRLPLIPIPLAKPDSDLTLDLQPLIESVYEISRYERSIDYAKQLDPPLSRQERTWLKRRLEEQKRS